MNWNLHTLCTAARKKALEVPMMTDTAKVKPSPPSAKAPSKVTTRPKRASTMVPAEMRGIAGRVTQRSLQGKRTRE